LNLQQERTRSILHHHSVTYITTYYNYSCETQYDSVYISLLLMHVSTNTQPELMVGGVGHPGWDILLEDFPATFGQSVTWHKSGSHIRTFCDICAMTELHPNTFMYSASFAYQHAQKLTTRFFTGFFFSHTSTKCCLWHCVNTSCGNGSTLI